MDYLITYLAHEIPTHVTITKKSVCSNTIKHDIFGVKFGKSDEVVSPLKVILIKSGLSVGIWFFVWKLKHSAGSLFTDSIYQKFYKSLLIFFFIILFEKENSEIVRIFYIFVDLIR